MVFATTAATADQLEHTDPTTGASTWSIIVDGVFFSLTQILREQAQAFYVNRGFSLKQIQPYTSACVYMTVLRNDRAPGRIDFVRDRWSVRVDGEYQRLAGVDEWLQRLKDRDARKAALVAFRWAQFPPEQSYEPGGDWNQGMIAVEMPPASSFDVIARWNIGGKPYEATLKGVTCAS